MTSLTLLAELRGEGDSAAWKRFVERYRPMVVSFALSLGLGEDEAQDAGQETMLAFVRGYREGRFDRAKGGLRRWLFRVARRKVVDIIRKRPNEVVVADRSDATAFLETIESPDEVPPAWEREWRRAVLRACMEEVARHVNAKTLAAFELCVFKEWPIEQVSQHLDMTPNAVYIAKSRVMAHIRDLRPKLEQMW